MSYFHSKNVFKLVIIALFILNASLEISSYFSSTSEENFQKIQQFLSSYDDLDAIQLTENLESNSDLWELTRLVIRDSDSIIWWKEIGLDYYQNDLEFIHFIPKNNGGSTTTECKLAFLDKERGMVLNQLIEAAGSRQRFSVSETPTPFFLTLNGNTPEKTIYFQPLEPVHSRLFTMLNEGSFFLGFIVFCLFVFIQFLHTNTWKKLFQGALILIAVRSATIILRSHSSHRFNILESDPESFILGLNQPLDLLLNAFCVFLIASLFYRKKISLPKFIGKTRKFSTVFLLFYAYLLLTGLFLWFVKFYVANVPDFLDMDHIFNSSLDGMAGLCTILLLAISIFISHHYLYSIILQVYQNVLTRFITFIVSSVAFLPVFFALDLHISLPYWIVSCLIYTFLFDLFIDTRRLSITWLIWWMIIISCFISLLLFHHLNQKQSFDLHSRIQDMYSHAEPEMVSIGKEIKQFYPSEELNSLVSIAHPFKINKADLVEYLKRFTQTVYKNYPIQGIDFFCLDKFGKSLINISLWEYENFEQQTAVSFELSEGLLYNPFSGHYFVQLDLSNLDHPGSPFKFYIKFESRKNLKKEQRKTINKKVMSFPIAIYKDGMLVSSDENNFPEQIPIEQGITTPSEQIISGEKWHIHEPGEAYQIAGKFGIIPLLKPVSLFSYIFCLIGLLLILFSISNFNLHIFPIEFNFVFDRASLRTRIQIAVITLIIFSFIIVGLVTIYYFVRLSTNYEQQSFAEKVTAVTKDINLNYLHYSDPNDPFNTLLRNKFSDISYAHNSEMIFYDSFGKLDRSTLKVSGDPFQIRMPFSIYEELNRNPSFIYFSTVPFLGKKQMRSSAFLKINAPANVHLGYLQILDHGPVVSAFNVSDFIGTLLNVYVFLFLIAGAIAIAVANSITNPIAELGDKLKKFKLGRQNEALKWKSKDELGALIAAYNQMIVKLDQSAELIAKTERDSAWREMAKQVAHEIKNPLTPMKLSIQYLEKAIHRNPEDSERLIDRVSSTLIEQIDNLSQIANEFSNFAKLPQGRNEKIVLNTVVETIHDLFRKREDMDIFLQEPIDDIIVFADRNHLIRILNNIVKNAIQAIPNDRRGRIDLELTKKDDIAVIKISDNGIGIPDHMKEKVFSPNFTTKSSGTGLGLAISANMIESFNGNIRFTTKENQGSQFYVSIPLMKLSDNYKDQKRVSLDE